MIDFSMAFPLAMGALTMVAACTHGSAKGDLRQDAGREAPPVAAASSAAVEGGEAALFVGDTAYRVQSAVKVRRGDLTEEYVIASDAAGCELVQDKVTGEREPRVRLSWKVAPNFTTGEPHAVDAWAVFVNERGAAGHGPLLGSEMKLELSRGTPDGGLGDRVSFQFASIHHEFLPDTLSGKGVVVPVECPRAASAQPPIDTLRVDVGRVRVGIRAVILNEYPSDKDGKPRRILELASQERACNDSSEGELLIATTRLGEGDTGLTVLGNALPDELRKTVNADVTQLIIKHGPIDGSMKKVSVSVDGTAQLRALPIKISGRATAHICREADMRKRD